MVPPHRAQQSPVCALLLVQLPQRNRLCLMEFLIVCPEYGSSSKLQLLEGKGSSSDSAWCSALKSNSWEERPSGRCNFTSNSVSSNENRGHNVPMWVDGINVFTLTVHVWRLRLDTSAWRCPWC
ncbi:hypothetical protein EYF80_028748 [Liparis tanakae]|uniref:Uncharacterized protein n=1 Tax=Liparis tanakae TaxID=230148 RepID=A0A4Z2H778_9TELE|nr:hypothetical protein EYF80_028748 [Liparis tanakae]